jgi:small subunit ribosomal protein S6
LMNVEATQKVLDALGDLFRYNDAILRNMVIRRDEAVLAASPVMAKPPRTEERR